MTYYSLSGQDKWVLETLNFKTNGFFVDLGSGNGIKYSNTYILETEYQWTGICVDVNKDKFKELEINRTSININNAIYNYDGTCLIDDDGKINDMSGTTVNCNTFDNIIMNSGNNDIIDYVSINVGGKELDVIKNIDFEKNQIVLMSIQQNQYKVQYNNIDPIFYHMLDNGFNAFIVGVLGEDPSDYLRYKQPYENWYYNKKYINI
jgi:hypothetical protein